MIQGNKKKKDINAKVADIYTYKMRLCALKMERNLKYSFHVIRINVYTILKFLLQI